jgi:hypothetical protein
MPSQIHPVDAKEPDSVRIQRKRLIPHSSQSHFPLTHQLPLSHSILTNPKPLHIPRHLHPIPLRILPPIHHWLPPLPRRNPRRPSLLPYRLLLARNLHNRPLRLLHLASLSRNTQFQTLRIPLWYAHDLHILDTAECSQRLETEHVFFFASMRWGGDERAGMVSRVVECAVEFTECDF